MKKKILFVDYSYIRENKHENILNTAIQEVDNHNRYLKDENEKIKIVIISDNFNSGAVKRTLKNTNEEIAVIYDKRISKERANYYLIEDKILHNLREISNTSPSESHDYIALLISDKYLLFSSEENPEHLREKNSHGAKIIKDSQGEGKTSLYYFRATDGKNGCEIIENVKGLINREFETGGTANKLKNLESIYSLVSHAVNQLAAYVREKEAESQSCWSFFTNRLYAVNHQDMLKASKELWQVLSAIFKNLNNELGSGIPQTLEIQPLSEKTIQCLLQSTRLRNVPGLINHIVKKLSNSAGHPDSGWRTQLTSLNKALETGKSSAIEKQKEVVKACIA